MQNSFIKLDFPVYTQTKMSRYLENNSLVNLVGKICNLLTVIGSKSMIDLVQINQNYHKAIIRK